MKTLHIINRQQLPDLLHCTLSDQDAVVFMAEGVYLSCGQKLEQIDTLTNIKKFALAEDMELRGLATYICDADCINYRDFVQLVLQFDRSITW